jgi:hypothetical protein
MHGKKTGMQKYSRLGTKQGGYTSGPRKVAGSLEGTGLCALPELPRQVRLFLPQTRLLTPEHVQDSELPVGQAGSSAKARSRGHSPFQLPSNSPWPFLICEMGVIRATTQDRFKVWEIHRYNWETLETH